MPDAIHRVGSAKALVIGGAAATLLLLGACSGSDDPPEPEPTASSSATPTPDTEPVERPTDARTDAGAIAFSEFALRTVVAVSAGDDVDDLLGIATSSCSSCVTLSKQVRTRTDVQEFDGPPTIAGARVIGKTDDGATVVEQTLTIPAGRTVDKKDGSVTGDLAESTMTIRVAASWTNGRWTLNNYSTES